MRGQGRGIVGVRPSLLLHAAPHTSRQPLGCEGWVWECEGGALAAPTHVALLVPRGFPGASHRSLTHHMYGVIVRLGAGVGVRPPLPTTPWQSPMPATSAVHYMAMCACVCVCVCVLGHWG